MVRCNLETNHNFEFKDSKMWVNINNKNHQKIVESSIIPNYRIIKQRPGFFNSLFSQVCSKKSENS